MAHLTRWCSVLPRIFILGLSLGLLSSPISAQTWLAEGQRWEYDVSGGWDPRYYGRHVHTVEGDTLLQGIPCKRVRIDYPDPTLPHDRRYVYASGNQVYVHNDFTGTFLKIYDFDLVVGDTVPLILGRRYIVDSVGTATLGGLQRRIQLVRLIGTNFLDAGQYLLVEGIGMATRFIDTASLPCSYFFLHEEFCHAAVDGWDIRFVCFDDAQHGLYDPHGLCNLTTAPTRPSLPERLPLGVAPNPAQGHTTLTASGWPHTPATLWVYDALGRLQLHQAVPDPNQPILLHTDQWPTGLYTLHLVAGQAQGQTRLLVQR